MQLRYKLSVVGTYGVLEVVRADCISSDARYILRYKPSSSASPHAPGMAAYSISGLTNQFEAFLSLTKQHRDEKERLRVEHLRKKDRKAAERAARAAAEQAARVHAREQLRQKEGQQQEWRRVRSLQSKNPASGASGTIDRAHVSMQRAGSMRHKRSSSGSGIFRDPQAMRGGAESPSRVAAYTTEPRSSRLRACDMHAAHVGVTRARNSDSSPAGGPFQGERTRSAAVGGAYATRSWTLQQEVSGDLLEQRRTGIREQLTTVRSRDLSGARMGVCVRLCLFLMRPSSESMIFCAIMATKAPAQSNNQHN
jgi:hypothetical protein